MSIAMNVFGSSLRLRAAAVAAAVIAAFSGPALAQDDPATGPVRECIAQVQSLTSSGVEAIASSAQGTVAQLREMKAAGATNEQIVAAGREGIAAVHMTARRTTAAVRETVAACIDELGDEITPAQRRALHRALETSARQVNRAMTRAENLIQSVVRRLTSDGRPDQPPRRD